MSTTVLTNAFDRSLAAQDQRRQQSIDVNRQQCIAACDSELAAHRANVQQAIANVDGLRARLEELAPARVEARARADLQMATTEGDAEAAHRAAEALQTILAGLDQSAVERLQVQARLVRCEADVVATESSLNRAESDALAARLAALDKDVAKAVRMYVEVAQTAWDRHYLLVELVKEHMRFAAALKSREISQNFTGLLRSPSVIELPTVPSVPGVAGDGCVRPIGRRIAQ